ncbi:phosphatidylinositol-specific phospholipase C [Yersinia mollaretii]|uniref:phosphatidylinositol-specific phospholipase C n=1 Tax=Yersinia mollaretii TaxID=33060 RepID=UPI000C16157F|nr:phosphatidylinositol-specific phospholipase C [Yersinia mollaretii]MDA5528985.1 phosphatidylinositol-specific phospholipase C [Yersinia mollaretii]MDR7875618.1 phosphatidylinositol-specific phospholipase C [Yersinia mollaretii]PHZ29763.1 phosphatidylinositol diacylglycerol-lyase [Yersinia mollaretii]WQC75007.1 phosphatidylinositol-specific phospholipase C [Yersinia mollaretii]
MNRKNWMGKLNDSMLLSNISITGTHNSAAIFPFMIPTGQIQTQLWDIDIQLNNGIRFLDIKCRLIEDVLALYHSDVYLNQNLSDILTSCLVFIKNNPTEFIILSIKQEGDDGKFHDVLLKSYLSVYLDYFFIIDKIPSIEEIRGKIILLCRYQDGNMGINVMPWEDDKTFVIDNGYYKVHVQDEYSGYTVLSIKNKRKPINDLIALAKRKGDDEIYINYTNIGGYLVTPFIGANGFTEDDGINKWFSNEYKHRTKSYLGIIVSDCVDAQEGEIIDTVINANF